MVFSLAAARREPALLGSPPLGTRTATSDSWLRVRSSTRKAPIAMATSTSPDPVGVVEDLAEGWLDSCRDVLDRRPGQVHEVLRTAEAAVRALVVEVKNRRLAQ